MSLTEKDELQEKLEDEFIDWQLDLKTDQQESIRFDHFDRSLEVLFLKRTPDFDRDNLDSLREKIRNINSSFRVSTIRVSDLHTVE